MSISCDTANGRASLKTTNTVTALLDAVGLGPKPRPPPRTPWELDPHQGVVKEVHEQVCIETALHGLVAQQPAVGDGSKGRVQLVANEIALHGAARAGGHIGVVGVHGPVILSDGSARGGGFDGVGRDTRGVLYWLVHCLGASVQGVWCQEKLDMEQECVMQAGHPRPHQCLWPPATLPN